MLIPCRNSVPHKCCPRRAGSLHPRVIPLKKGPPGSFSCSRVAPRAHDHSSESWNPGGGREGYTVSISLVPQIVKKEGVLCGPAKIEPNSIAPVERVLTCLTSGVGCTRC